MLLPCRHQRSLSGIAALGTLMSTNMAPDLHRCHVSGRKGKSQAQCALHPACEAAALLRGAQPNAIPGATLMGCHGSAKSSWGSWASASRMFAVLVRPVLPTVVGVHEHVFVVSVDVPLKQGKGCLQGNTVNFYCLQIFHSARLAEDGVALAKGWWS